MKLNAPPVIHHGAVTVVDRDLGTPDSIAGARAGPVNRYSDTQDLLMLDSTREVEEPRWSNSLERDANAGEA